MKRSGTQTLERGIALLRAAAEDNRQGSTLAELAGRTGLDRSTAHRMLRCLVDEKLLSYEPAARAYHLGSLAFQLGLASGERFFRDAAAPILSDLAQETGDTAFLMILVGDESLCIDRREGSYPVKTLVVEVGTRRPLGMGAAALAMLSALDIEPREAAIEANARRNPSFPGMISAPQLRKMVDATRNQGYAAMPVIGVPGVRAVGYPICLSGKVVGGLSVAAIEPRMKTEREKLVARMLKEAASRVIERVGSATRPTVRADPPAGLAPAKLRSDVRR